MPLPISDELIRSLTTIAPVTTWDTDHFTDDVGDQECAANSNTFK